MTLHCHNAVSRQFLSAALMGVKLQRKLGFQLDCVENNLKDHEAHVTVLIL